jgi:hypothetical protein
MANLDLSVKEWLDHEDSLCREERLARLKWLVSKMPSVDYLFFRGGPISKYLFEEARYCYVYGQFLATIVIGLAFIEHTLAALFYMIGRADLERASLIKLLKEGLNYEWLTKIEFENLQHARQIRNPITHFRKPGNDDSIVKRGIIKNEHPYEIIEKDARYVMETVLKLLGTSLLSVTSNQ